MMWGISELKTLAEAWPANPEGSDWIDPSVWTQPKRNASFITRAEFKSEIERRLKWTKEDGEDLVTQVQEGLEYDKLTRRARMALNYISGKPKKTPYSQWNATNSHRTKVQLQERIKRRNNRKRHTGR